MTSRPSIPITAHLAGTHSNCTLTHPIHPSVFISHSLSYTLYLRDRLTSAKSLLEQFWSWFISAEKRSGYTILGRGTSTAKDGIPMSTGVFFSTVSAVRIHRILTARFGIERSIVFGGEKEKILLQCFVLVTCKLQVVKPWTIDLVAPTVWFWILWISAPTTRFYPSMITSRSSRPSVDHEVLKSH